MSFASPAPPYLLPPEPDVEDALRAKVSRDFSRFAGSGLPPNLSEYLLDEYRVDVSAEYAGYAVPNPWGKASGQLSMSARQVEEDVAAGLGFVVLKTVIAQNESGAQSMGAWAIKEARMVAEPIVGQSGESGWTISWKGRGWWHPFEDYLQLVRDARQLAHETGTLIVPSCKYHLPNPDEADWKVDEYAYTTGKLLAAWRGDARENASPMPLEKDFSPTLAGSDRAAQQQKILEWLRTVPRLIRQSAAKGSLRIGLKVFNALFDDEFQLRMLRDIHTAGADAPDFFVYGNRLFDPQREFDGHRGIAYGGPDLSDRNLRVMTAFRLQSPSCLPWSATGNVCSGRMACEYALRGATSFQLHTFFQLPAENYAMKHGSKTAKALLELYFHPQTGFLVWIHHLARRLGIADSVIRFLDIARMGPGLIAAAEEPRTR